MDQDIFKQKFLEITNEENMKEEKHTVEIIRECLYYCSAAGFTLSVGSALSMIWTVEREIAPKFGWTAVLLFGTSFVLFRLADWLKVNKDDFM